MDINVYFKSGKPLKIFKDDEFIKIENKNNIYFKDTYVFTTNKDNLLVSGILKDIPESFDFLIYLYVKYRILFGFDNYGIHSHLLAIQDSLNYPFDLIIKNKDAFLMLKDYYYVRETYKYADKMDDESKKFLEKELIKTENLKIEFDNKKAEV